MNFISTFSDYGQLGVMVDVQAKNGNIRNEVELVEEFIRLCQDIAIHIAESDPSDISELLSQPFVKNPDQSISELLKEKSESLDDPISVSRFIRWDAGSANPENDPIHDPALAMQARRA